MTYRDTTFFLGSAVLILQLGATIHFENGLTPLNFDADSSRLFAQRITNETDPTDSTHSFDWQKKAHQPITGLTLYPEPAAESDADRADDREAIVSRKEFFFKKISPLVHRVNSSLTADRSRLLRLITALEQDEILQKRDQRWLATLAENYRVSKDPLTSIDARDELLSRVDIIPVDLALAQAALESAWGKSRFVLEGNNLFGVIANDPAQGIGQQKRSGEERQYFRKFSSLQDSIANYILLLNSHPAYEPLRQIRQELRANYQPLNGEQLAEGLIKYSIKGQDYINQVQQMISYNRLDRFRYTPHHAIANNQRSKPGDPASDA
ncbi:MAG: glucosaminidase domain-containing protein [Gammaproteobacteria bacterium]|nr:glucosaminidase domain-containing protein [Gammaproteobacteria bacterium]